MNAPIQSDPALGIPAQGNKVQKLLFDPAAPTAAQPEPLSTTIGEIARLYDVAPNDALDEVIRTGCRSYWWNGQTYRVEGIRRLIQDSWQWDVTPEIEVDLTAREQNSLDSSFGSDEPLPAGASAKPLRKFVASESALPTATIQGRQQLG